MDNPGIPGADEMVTAGSNGSVLREEMNFESVETPCFVVGIGASAGGQIPLEHIFTFLPADCNLSFVVVMHLLRTVLLFLPISSGVIPTMDVLTAEDDTLLLPNTIHVASPGTLLAANSGRLRVEGRTGRSAGANHPIDHFFTSLAEDYGGARHCRSTLRFRNGRSGRREKDQGAERYGHCPGACFRRISVHARERPCQNGAADLILTTEDIPLKIAEIARGYCSLTQQSCLSTTLEGPGRHIRCFKGRIWS